MKYPYFLYTVPLFTFLTCLIMIQGCQDKYPAYDDIELVYNISLPQDENGFYHLPLADSWQTIKRLSARLISMHAENRDSWQRDLVETIMIYWQSSHYWVLDDTLGYIVKGGLTDDLKYVNYDTVYVWGFAGQIVPTVNSQSYPANTKPTIYEVNTVFAPVQSMAGDTVTVWTYFWDLNTHYVEEKVQIILHGRLGSF